MIVTVEREKVWIALWVCVGTSGLYFRTTIVCHVFCISQRSLSVAVVRNGQRVQMSLIPQRWSGRGLLGWDFCSFSPSPATETHTPTDINSWELELSCSIMVDALDSHLLSSAQFNVSKLVTYHQAHSCPCIKLTLMVGTCRLIIS